MPVLSNENNKVLGIITITDVVKLYDKEVENIMKARDHSNIGIDNNDNGMDNSDDHHKK